MLDFLARVFDPTGFPPRWRCGAWTPAHGWLHVVSDAAVGAAYFAISGALVYFAVRKRGLPFRRMFLLFAAFGVLCGLTHLMEAVIFWWPAYRLAGVLKLATAAVSCGAAVALVPVFPKVLALRTSDELEREVAARRAAEGKLVEANAELERRVAARTADLDRANADLTAERERFQTTLESLADGVIATDTAGRVTFLNPAAEAYTGWPAGDAAGAPLAAVFRGVDPATGEPADPAAALAGSAGHGPAADTTLVRRDGAERPVEFTAAPIRAAGGAVAGAVVVFRDVSARRALVATQAEQVRLAGLRADVSAALAADQPKAAALRQCCQALVDHAGAAFARVWTVPDGGGVLELRASAGRYTHLDGPHARISVGEYKIGRIAASGRPHLTNELGTDPQVSDPAWAAREGLTAFAGYPLAVDGRVVGVVALFARRPLPAAVLADLAALADGLAQYVERRRSEARVRESEARFRAMADTAPVLIWTTGPDGGAEYVNRRWLEFTGQSFEEARGKGWQASVHPDDQAPAAGLCAAAHRDRTGFQGEVRLRRHDGEYRWVVDTGVPRWADGGAFLGLVGSCVDIHDRREAEQALAESNRLYRLLADNMEDVVTLHAPDGRYLYVSPSGAGANSHPPADLVGQDCYPLIHPDDIPAVAAAGAANARGERTRTEWRLRQPDGSYVWLESTAGPVRGPDGAVTSIVCCSRDITTRKSLEDKVRQSQKLEAVGSLAGGVAHDFNNLLTIVLGCADQLADGLPAGDPHHQLAADIQDAAGRGAALTRQLLAFSRRQVVKVEPFDANAAVRDATTLLGRLLGEDIAVTVRLDPAAGRVRGDAAEFGQVVMNLAVNARDAMPRGGRLRVETAAVEVPPGGPLPTPDAQPGRYVRLTVADSGHGMTAEVKQRLFEPFFTTKPVGQGTGLGLATVYGIARQSEGFVTVDSEPGQGAAFHVYMPQLTGPAAAPVPDAAAPTGAGAGTETVLVVEDDATVRTLATRILARRGYRVLAAASGDAALTLCDELSTPPDLVLTDVVMPGISGRELAEALARRFPALKLGFLSGYTADAVLRNGVKDDGVAFLQKPYTPDSLSRFVRQVLDGDGLR